jgi:hypothetical protein
MIINHGLIQKFPSPKWVLFYRLWFKKSGFQIQQIMGIYCGFFIKERFMCNLSVCKGEPVVILRREGFSQNCTPRKTIRRYKPTGANASESRKDRWMCL